MVIAAMEILMREGLLEAHGERRRRRIKAAVPGQKADLPIRLLLDEESEAHNENTVNLRHRPEERGYQANSPRRRCRI
jgi:hypothetical protein